MGQTKAPTNQNQAVRDAKLAKALRANLKRRKTTGSNPPEPIKAPKA